MSAFVLVTGELFRPAEARTSSGGKRYVVASIASRDGQEKTFWRVMAFSETAQAGLLRLGVGEALSAQGRLSVKLFEKDGETRIAHEMIANTVTPLRAAPKPKGEKVPAATALDTRTREERVRGVRDPDLDDNIPF